MNYSSTTTLSNWKYNSWSWIFLFSKQIYRIYRNAFLVFLQTKHVWIFLISVSQSLDQMHCACIVITFKLFNQSKTVGDIFWDNVLMSTVQLIYWNTGTQLQPKSRTPCSFVSRIVSRRMKDCPEFSLHSSQNVRVSEWESYSR